MSPKTSTSGNKTFLLFGATCSADTFPGTFLKKCLDTGITGKLIGMLVVSLLGFALLITFNMIALQRVADRNHIIKDIAIPQYKVSQYILRSINGFKISLIHTLNAPKLQEDNRHIVANKSRLTDLKTLTNSLQHGGPVLDVAKVANKTLDVFTLQKSDNLQMNTLIASLSQESELLDQKFHSLTECLINQCAPEQKEILTTDLTSSLDNLYSLVINMAVTSNTQHTDQFSELEDIIANATSRSLFIGSGIAAILTIATLLYIFLIATPLRDILNKISCIAKGDSERCQKITVKSNDEVGQLAHQLNIMVDNTFSLNNFKAIIEEEESTTEVIQRLAHLLRDRYHLENLYIYEITGTKNNMSVGYASNFENVCSAEIFDDANFCRAKRTGHAISSLEFPDICKHFPHKDIFEHHCIPMMANGKVVGVVQLLHKTGSTITEQEEFDHLVTRGSRYIRESTPVIEAKRFSSALQETALRDPMTDLYNRRFLETYSNTLVASTLRRASRVGILMCDMDYFKEVNDNYGHETGDVVLIKTAEVLKNCVRASDIVIRYGGEEFVVLLIDVKTSQDILDVAEKIRSTMELAIINVPDGTLQKTLSIGVSEFPGDTEGFWEAIKFADVALYRAKNEGRNRVVRFNPEMWEQEKY